MSFHHRLLFEGFKCAFFWAYFGLVPHFHRAFAPITSTILAKLTIPPEVLLVLSDMQFHPPSEVSPSLFNLLPWRYRGLVLKSAFRQMPPLAAAAVLYREVLGSDVSLVLWNLASYEGAPAPSGMERVLMLSGFDANSFRIIEQWLQAGSPGTAMPTNPQDSPAGLGQSGSSFEAVLAALRRY